MLSSARLLERGARRGARGNAARVVRRRSTTTVPTPSTCAPRLTSSSCGTVVFPSWSFPSPPPTLPCPHHHRSSARAAPRRLYNSTPSTCQPFAASARSFSSSHYREEDLSSSPSPVTALDFESNRASTSRVCSILAAQQQHDDGPSAPLEVWLEGEELVQFWIRQRNVESVVSSVNLLHQLVRTYCPRLELTTLHSVLNNWRVVWWRTTGLAVEDDPDAVHNLLPEEEEDQHEAEELRLEEADRLIRAKHRNARLAADADRSVDAAIEIEIDTPRQMFHRMMDYHQSYGLPVTEKTFYLILEASISNGDVVETAAFAQELLDTCLQLFEQTGRQEVYPTTHLCNLVLRAWAVSRLPESSPACEAILDRMTAFQIPPDTRTYRWLIASYRHEESVRGAGAAEQTLRRMWSEYEQGCEEVQPCHRTYTSVITAWAWSGSIDAGWRGEILMKELLEAKPVMKWHKERSAFNAVLLCYANLKTYRSAKQAYEMLLHQMNTPDKPPDKESYLIVLKALSKVGESDLAEQLLQRVPEELVSTVMYIDVLKALARDCRPHALDRARDLFDQMKRLGKRNPDLMPDLDTYNAYLDCFAKCKGSRHVGEESYEVLEEMKAAGIKPNDATYACVLLVWTQYGHIQRALDILALIPDPGIQCYNVVLSAFIKSKDPQAAYEALKMQRDLIRNGPQPNAYTYTTVISCFANSMDSDKKRSARQAESLLREMQRLYREGDSTVRPTRVTYNAVMNAFARASDPNRAEELLEEMYDDYLANGNADARPEASSFNTVLKGWALWPDRAEANRKVLETFARMEELARTLPEVAPNVITYTTLIMSFGMAGQPREADKVFWELESLHREGKLDKGPSMATFTTLRRAWSDSRDPDRHDRVAQIDQEMDRRFGASMSDRRWASRR